MNSRSSRKPDYHFKGNSGGEWRHGVELIGDLVSGAASLKDEELQRELLDWMFTDNVNVFVNNEDPWPPVFSIAPKRGNRAYAAKKGRTLDRILGAMEGKSFDEPVPGLRPDMYRQTRMLFATLTFSHKRYSAEEAWASLRSTCPEGCTFECGALNRFGAAITKIFGGNGKITCKEADGSGYPAPHSVILLDRPVLVKRHVGRNGRVTWRLANERQLKRIGKDRESRDRSRLDVEVASEDSSVWPYGLYDIQGIVAGCRVDGFANGFTYLFKYLVKTVSAENRPDIVGADSIGAVGSKPARTMLYTHLGNKCFRTRDIVFGKAFKDRIGLLPDVVDASEPKWRRVATIPEWFARRIEPLFSDPSSVSSIESPGRRAAPRPRQSFGTTPTFSGSSAERIPFLVGNWLPDTFEGSIRPPSPLFYSGGEADGTLRRAAQAPAGPPPKVPGRSAATPRPRLDSYTAK